MSNTKGSGRTTGQRMGIAAIILAVSILLSRVLGFLREAVIAYQHGASAMTDAYYAAFTLPDLMNYFLAGGTLSITFIPLFSSYMTRDDEEGGWRLFSTIATTMGLVLGVMTVVGMVVTPYAVSLLFPGFTDADQFAMAVTMTRIVFPAQLAFYLGGLLQATLFVREVFWPSAIAPLIYNLCIILGGVLLEPWFGIQGFSIGVVVGALLGPLALPLWASRRHVRYRFRLAPRDPDFKRFVLLTLPLMVGVSLVTVDEWLLRYFGSMHEHGAISWLNNSRKLMLVLFAVIGQAAGQAALPYLTRLFHEGKHEEMGQMLATSMQRVAFLASLGTGALVATAYPLVHLVFRRGQFTEADANMTGLLLILFALGLVAWSAQTLLVRGFYARQDTLTPMLIGTVVAVAALPVYYFFDRWFGVPGLAAATTVGITLNTLATLVVYRRQGGALPMRPMAAGLGRGMLFAVACGGAAWATSHFASPYLQFPSPWSEILVLMLAGVSFGAALVALGALVRPPELEFVVQRVLARLRR